MAGALQIIFLCVIGFVFGRFTPLTRFRFIVLITTISFSIGFGPAVFVYWDQLPESLVLIAPFSVVLLAFPWLFASIIGRILRHEAKRRRTRSGANKPEISSPITPRVD